MHTETHSGRNSVEFPGLNWNDVAVSNCYQLSLCTKRRLVYLGVHRYFHSTVHVSTALCTCWGTCWALDPDSCCTCPPFWAEPVAWTSTLCLDTRHGFITLSAHAPTVVRLHALRCWQPLWRLAGLRLAAAYRSMAALTRSSQLELAVGGEWCLLNWESVCRMTVLTRWLRPDLNDFAMLSQDDLSGTWPWVVRGYVILDVFSFSRL